MVFRPPLSTPPVDPFRLFYVLTGVSLVAVFSGFSVCLFDINQISACVDHAEEAMEVFHKFGDHILQWFLALVKEVLRRYPINGH